jgi:hypothetical protein
VYSRPEERVVLIVYRAKAIGRPQTTSEAVEVRSFAPDEIPWEVLVDRARPARRIRGAHLTLRAQTG